MSALDKLAAALDAEALERASAAVFEGSASYSEAAKWLAETAPGALASFVAQWHAEDVAANPPTAAEWVQAKQQAAQQQQAEADLEQQSQETLARSELLRAALDEHGGSDERVTRQVVSRLGEHGLPASAEQAAEVVAAQRRAVGEADRHEFVAREQAALEWSFRSKVDFDGTASDLERAKNHYLTTRTNEILGKSLDADVAAAARGETTPGLQRMNPPSDAERAEKLRETIASRAQAEQDDAAHRGEMFRRGLAARPVPGDRHGKGTTGGRFDDDGFAGALRAAEAKARGVEPQPAGDEAA